MIGTKGVCWGVDVVCEDADSSNSFIIFDLNDCLSVLIPILHVGQTGTDWDRLGQL